MAAEVQVRPLPLVPVLEVQALRKDYGRHRLWGRGYRVAAVCDASLALLPGETLALVGRSGSGKSTLARCLAQLESFSNGAVRFCGEEVAGFDSGRLRDFRRQVQLVLQDSATALNPRFTALEVVTEPLRICRVGTASQRRVAGLDLMRQVELPESLAPRRPSQLSGGQRQRLAIARALALRPSVLILDEALTGLDRPVQHQILALLADLKQAQRLTYLLISHDLGLMEAWADRIAVMEAGRIVECAATAELFANPRHSHSRQLLDAIPTRFMAAGASRAGED